MRTQAPPFKHSNKGPEVVQSHPQPRPGRGEHLHSRRDRNIEIPARETVQAEILRQKLLNPKLLNSKLLGQVWISKRQECDACAGEGSGFSVLGVFCGGGP